MLVEQGEPLGLTGPGSLCWLLAAGAWWIAARCKCNCLEMELVAKLLTNPLSSEAGVLKWSGCTLTFSKAATL